MRHTGVFATPSQRIASFHCRLFSMSPDNPFLPASHTSPAAAAAMNTHTTTEYELDLPAHWKVVPSGDGNAVTFQSDADRAALYVNVDFYEIPADKARATAERLINTRLATLAKQAPGQVDMFDSGVNPHWQGQGLEMYYAAHVARQDVVMYFVYVMPRRVLNLTLVSKNDRQQAMALLRAVHSHFRPKLA